MPEIYKVALQDKRKLGQLFNRILSAKDDIHEPRTLISTAIESLTKTTLS